MTNTADILIGEDDAVLREVYMKKFTLSGFNIRVATNGEEVLSEIEKKHPDVLVLDINMPIVDGFSVLKKLPKEEREFPIIMLTNFGDEKSREKGMSLGADDFFVKSEMTIKTLIEMVSNVLESKA